MRKLYLFLCLLPAVPVAQVYDDFSDADLLHDPAWSGSLEHFKISYSSAVPEGQRPALQLDAPGAGISGLTTACEVAGDLQWQCWIKQSFNSSSGNFARFYLMSDSDDLSGPLNGYFIQTGGSDDSVIFCRQDSLAVSRLFAFDSLSAGNSANSFRLKIMRSPFGFWQFYADPAGGQGLKPCGEFTDTGISSGLFSGLYCQYTSSNASKFYFDDFYAGPRIVDSIPPALLSAEAISVSEIKLGFSEALDELTAINKLNYSLSPGSANPSGASLLADPSRVLLSFDPPMQEGLSYELDITSMKDLAGNESGPLSASLSYYRVKPYDIVFSEIMADPSPPFNLPEFEYLEIHNRSAFPLNIGADTAGFVFRHIVRSDDTPVDPLADTLHVIQYFGNCFAYDDGSAEAGYGLSPGGAKLAIRYKVFEADTLWGALLYFNQVVDEANIALFDLAVWRDNNGKPGELIYRRPSFKPTYSSTLNRFISYPFDSAIVVNNIFYIGWIQHADVNLNLGLDRSQDRHDQIYFNAGGEWQNSQIDGNLMIRPLMGTPENDIPMVSKEHPVQFRLFPNPHSGNELKVMIPENFPGSGNGGIIRFFNAFGQLSRELVYTGQPLSIGELPEGFYIVWYYDLESGKTASSKFIRIR